MYDFTEKKIMVLGSSQSFLLHSIVFNLNENGIEVVQSNGDMDTIGRLGKKFNAILIFVDEEIIEQQPLFTYIKDMVLENDIPIFMIGYPDEMSLLESTLPTYLIRLRFERPINASKVVFDIINYLDEHVVRDRKKILVVDDSASTLRSLKSVLEKDYQVILASSGAMAIKYLSQDLPDLVLLDYEMPIISGKQVLEIIRYESDFSNLPVIFLTARGDKQAIMDVMSLRPEGYLLKTMNFESVLKAINEFFNKKKAEN